MEIGNEISHKIRSAIKAKLVELGAYVDEELPDYIMVMVANKKSQFQMSEDLGLFLGNNTERFTTWLHSLLLKLQSLTAETAVGKLPIPEKPDEQAKVKEQLQQATTGTDDISSKPKKDVAHESNPKLQESVDTPDSKGEGSLQTSSADNQDTLTAGIGSSATSTSTTKLSPESDVTVRVEHTPSPVLQETVKLAEKKAADIVKTPFDSDLQVVEDDDLAELLLTENDELAEELEQEPVVLVTATDKIKKSDYKTVQISDDEVSSELPSGRASIIMSRRSPPRSSRPKAVTSPIRQSVHRSAVVRESAHRSAFVRVVEPRPMELQTRKRRGPVSVIGSVTHDIDSDDDDAGYDPHNPAVGSVASVIRVTARKSSVPPKLQANKNLLLKAMGEAEKSVESQRRVAITPVRPFMRSEGRDRDRDRGDRDQRERIREHERHDRSSASSSSSRDPHHPSLRLAQNSLRQAVTQSSSRSTRNSDPPVYIPTRKVQPAPRMDLGDRRGIISKSKRLEAEERAWLDHEKEVSPPRKLVKREKRPAIVNFVIEAELGTDSTPPAPEPREALPLIKIKREPVSPQQLLPDPLPVAVAAAKPAKTLLSKRSSVIDSRVVEYEPDSLPSPAPPTPEEEVVSESGSQGVPMLLEDNDQDDLCLDQDVIEVTSSPPPPPQPATSLMLGGQEEDLRQSMLREKVKDKTRFVVTLDGVDSDQYDEMMEVAGGGGDGQGFVVKEGLSMAARLGQHPASAAQVAAALLQQATQQAREAAAATLISPPKIQPMNINLRDSDEEGEEEEVMEEVGGGEEEEESSSTSPLKQAKMMERCKFWPACVNGAACDYHHPTTHCRTFPMCKFGDKCLYIHPNCRYDSKCSRPDCPFTHSSRRSAVPAFKAAAAAAPPHPHMVPMYRAPHPPPHHHHPPVAVSRGGGGGGGGGSQTPPQCRFFPACSNMSCPFYHPKPCRFGLTCTGKDKGCPFYHPSLPTKEQLTWAAGGKAKGATTAASAATPSQFVAGVKTSTWVHGKV